MTLRDLAETQTDQTLVGFLFAEYEGIDWSTLCSSGRVLLLLDGLDEVKDEDFQRVRRAIERFTSQNPLAHVVMTCRIAAQEYVFTDFADVQMADFTDAQIDQFSRKWFATNPDPETANRFMLRLEGNARLRGLATKPLLLVFLCTIFDDGGKMTGSSSDIYGEVFDILLRKWDSKRAVERRSKASLAAFERLIESLAHLGSLQTRDLFPRAWIEARNFECGDNQSSVPAIDFLAFGEELGILIERWRGVYSFAHRTFQEYLTARRISTQPSLRPDVLEHIWDRRWGEIWRLLREMKGTGFPFEEIMSHLHEHIARDADLQAILKWIHRKVPSRIDPWVAFQARFALACLGTGIRKNFAWSTIEDMALNGDITRLNILRDLLSDHVGGPEYSLRNERGLLIGMPGLKAEVYPLLVKISQAETATRLQLIHNFRDELIRKCDIGHEWCLSEDQLVIWNQYIDGCGALSKLLSWDRIDVLNELLRPVSVL